MEHLLTKHSIHLLNKVEGFENLQGGVYHYANEIKIFYIVFEILTIM